MAGLPPHHEGHFPGNTSPAGAPWGTTAPAVLQQSLSQAVPPSHHRINLSHGHPPPPLAADRAAPHIYHDVGINNYTGVVEGVPAQAQIIAPAVPMQERHVFGDAAQHAPACPAPEAFNEWPHEGPLPGEPAAEILRQLASHYLHHPDSQVGMFHVEITPAGGSRVTIALEIQVAGLSKLPSSGRIFDGCAPTVSV